MEQVSEEGVKWEDLSSGGGISLQKRRKIDGREEAENRFGKQKKPLAKLIKKTSINMHNQK